MAATGFPSRYEWSFTICLTPYNHKYNRLSAVTVVEKSAQSETEKDGMASKARRFPHSHMETQEILAKTYTHSEEPLHSLSMSLECSGSLDD